MRHKYQITALVLSRAPLGETSALVTLLSGDLGLIRARAQSLRRPGAKLAAGLSTLSESAVMLVRGVETWRVAGALLTRSWFSEIPRAARVRAARVAGLLLRLVPGESPNPELFTAARDFLEALAILPEAEHDSAEALVVLRLLHALGLDAGVLPSAAAYGRAALAELGERRTVIARINRGIAASGL